MLEGLSSFPAVDVVQREVMKYRVCSRHDIVLSDADVHRAGHRMNADDVSDDMDMNHGLLDEGCSRGMDPVDDIFR